LLFIGSIQISVRCDHLLAWNCCRKLSEEIVRRGFLEKDESGAANGGAHQK
jgi:hypothetical protein